jgi:hypothetical protein
MDYSSHFEEVRNGFLLVGHTHLDIDQQFSCILHVLKGDDINLLSELLRLIQNGILRHVEEIYAICRVDGKYLGLETGQHTASLLN